ncbi:metallophosphatase family protein [Coriobacteriia bacterium Es71-Z0120]|uniref:metallophosphoesterase family protein n=1 Tax=Parvivirga hydrogeniphila TaxID=2939460 RepID=UPI0022608E79|nr:metallophosphoesterase family protein [Parvivirga hydrogeniphila]MCL4078128.1 metallophosphatase family protein [Parvivirga hydrogeniphila]
MRRIALFSDIHGNLVALDAVLADMEASGLGAAVERYCLGDLIGYGPDPGGVVERVRSLGVPTIVGNYDDGVAAHRGQCGCYYGTEQAKEDGEASYRITERLLSAGDAEWLLGLPHHLWVEHEGASVLLTHGSPRRINEYLLLDRTDAQLARLAIEAGAHVVCHGHIHIPYHRALDAAAAADMRLRGARELPPTEGRIHYVSSGSVGKPKDGDPRACWVDLVMGDEREVRDAAPDDPAAGPIGTTDVWLGLVVHRVPYDVEAVVRAMLDAGFPETLADALRRG